MNAELARPSNWADPLANKETTSGNVGDKWETWDGTGGRLPLGVHEAVVKSIISLGYFISPYISSFITIFL